VLQGAYTNNKTTIGCQNIAATQFNWTYVVLAFELWSLKVAGTPTGLTYVSSGSTPSSSFNSTYGFQTAGNASGFAYPLQTTNSYNCSQGGWLFQASVWFYNRCSDPAMGFWTGTNRQKLTWSWSTTNSNGISFQCNCDSYPMLNTPSGGANGDTMSSAIGNYVTLHVYITSSTVSGLVTIGLDDWNISGTKIGGGGRTKAYGFGSTDFYMGLGSDYDGASLGSNSTNFQAIKITPQGLLTSVPPF
jgi:hypothetical protein